MSERVSRPALVLSLPSRTEFLALVRDVTRQMAEVAGFDPQQADQLAVAVDEAATNVMEHAYKGAGDRRFELRFGDSGEALRIDVVDDGERLDRRTVPRLDLERYASERRTGGLGMELMGRIMDDVSFERRSARNVCCMVKRKPGPRRGPA